MSVLNENTIIGSSGAGGDYEIEQSLRFNDDDSAYLSRTLSTPTNRNIYTYSFWVKRGVVGSAQYMLFGYSANNDQNFTALFFESNDTLKVGGYSDDMLVSTQLFRDPSAWYHIIMAVDTTQATQSNRIKMYVNGEAMPYTVAGSFPTQNEDTGINGAHTHSISGRQPFDSAYPFDGYLAEVNFIDGQALTPDSFGETGDYGEWKPTKYAGTYGTNGFYLKFENASSLGNDSAGSINWTPNNLAATDQMLDSPTNNFSVMNGLTVNASTLAEGNLAVVSGSGAFQHSFSTITMTTGKWYMETLISIRSGAVMVGIADANNSLSSLDSATVGTTSYRNDGTKRLEGTYSSYGSTYAAGDIIGVAVNVAAGTVTFYKNNVSQGAISAIFTNTAFDLVVSDTATEIANFGQDSSFAGNKTAQGNQDANSVGDFYYAPPTGYLALCTSNLPDVDVIPSEHFNTVLYTGNGSTQSITGVGLKPDFVWWKSRNGSNSNVQNDSVRGVELMLRSNLTNAESTGDLTSFDSDGFSVRNTVDNGNYNGETYVAWNWKAGGSASTITTGTIDSVVSANPSAGFSIVKYVGNNTANATIAHGLSQTPTFIITKNMTNSAYWATYLFNDANKKYYMNASSSDAATWITPAAALITLVQTNANNINESGSSYINYCFHSVDGYSRVGEYTGNGNSDGTFVNCGFRPKYVLIRRNLDAFWNIFDTERGPYNVIDNVLWANGGDAENVSSNWNIDLLSNGFKQRSTHDYMNDNGETFFFIAFAETPFKFSNAR